MLSDASNEKPNYSGLCKHESIFFFIWEIWKKAAADTGSDTQQYQGKLLALLNISSQDRMKEVEPLSEKQKLLQELHRLPPMSGSHDHLSLQSGQEKEGLG